MGKVNDLKKSADKNVSEAKKVIVAFIQVNGSRETDQMEFKSRKALDKWLDKVFK